MKRIIICLILLCCAAAPAWAEKAVYRLGAPAGIQAETAKDIRPILLMGFDKEAGGTLFLAKFGGDAIRYEYEGEWYEFQPLDHAPALTTSVANSFTMADYWQSTDLAFEVRDYGVKCSIVLNDDTGPRTFQFRVTTSSGWNAEWIRPVTARSADDALIPVEIAQNGGILTYRLPEDLSKYSFPIIIDPSFDLGSGVDDTTGWSTLNDATNARLYCGNTAGYDYDVYLRWPIDIPAGSIINSAYITFTANDSDSSAMSAITIYALDLASAPAWQNSNGFGTANYANRAALDAIAYESGTSVSWTPGAWTASNTYDTPSLVSLLQNIVDDPDYSTSNPIGFLFYHSSTNVRRRAVSYDGSASDSADLVVDYSPPGGAPQVIIIRR